ncbi:MAG: mechanosensitive ion channel family protein [Bacteroidota bacterium]
MEENTALLEEYLSIEKIIPFLTNIAIAVVSIVVGLWIIKRIIRLLQKSLERSKMSGDIIPFLVSIADVGLKVLLIFTVAGIVGIETTSFVAVVGALAFAVGMSLQGSLSNFAAGVIILLFRPYKTGDWIELDERFGKVEEIQIFNTIVVTPGQKTLIIPNGEIVGNVVTNYSIKGHVRVEMEVAMAYEESYPKVEKIIKEVLDNIPEVLENPAPEVGIIQYDTHYIVVGVRPYLHPDKYWDVRFEVYRQIKKAFHDNGIKMAYSEGVELGTIGE